MALYSYEAYAKDGKRVSGTVDASSLASAKEQLSKQGLFVVTVIPTSYEKGQGLLSRLFARSVTVKEKILFSKQLAVLLRAGVPLLQALELLVDQFEGTLHNILVSVKDDIKEGLSLADTLNKYPQTFDTIYVQLVRAGEASGRLEVVLERLTEYLERREATTKKIKSALQYPIIQLVVAVVVVVALLVVVIPQLQDVFLDLGARLPFSTRFVIGASEFMQRYYLFILAALILSIIGFRYWRKSARGARTWDAIKIKLPGIKYVTKTNAVVQFSYTLGVLLEGGVNLAEALDIVVKVIDNRILADTLNEARDKIIKQGKIAQYLKQTGIFPPIAYYLIKTGEESGQLDAMLLTVADNYEVELNELIDRVTGLISPIMLIVMALVVGFIIMAIAGPMTQLTQQLGSGQM